MPEFAPLPMPLYASTAKAKLEAVDDTVKLIKRTAKRIPIMAKTASGTEYQDGFNYEPEAKVALEAWEKQRERIKGALAG